MPAAWRVDDYGDDDDDGGQLDLASLRQHKLEFAKGAAAGELNLGGDGRCGRVCWKAGWGWGAGGADGGGAGLRGAPPGPRRSFRLPLAPPRPTSTPTTPLPPHSPTPRQRSLDDYVVLDPLLEAAKGKFSKTAQKAKKAASAWAGRGVG
jgi:hypothetical protein